MTFCFPLLQDDLEKGHFLTVLPDVVRSNNVQFQSFSCPEHRVCSCTLVCKPDFLFLGWFRSSGSPYPGNVLECQAAAMIRLPVTAHDEMLGYKYDRCSC